MPVLPRHRLKQLTATGRRKLEETAHKTRGVRVYRRAMALSGLGVFRWVVGNAHALINKFPRLRIRDDVRSEMYEAFLLLGVSKINRGFS